ncbi:organic cation transporter protein [Strongylocentrotus purpuratus]|uniref:Major facilitator superfamily (MFS) profile domain-containing protein n=1 Tax=Strongylocentrotus purpuratus TaxID=7668 RepID=A0A7M7P9Z7_STRPU|nr:organic cation transporter protein [Strongylocentrotus purpuratus]
MKFDDILVILGEFGPYQRRMYALVCLMVIPLSWTTLIQVFAMGNSDHWCQVPGWNDTVCEEEYGAPCNLITKKTFNIPFVEANGSKLEFQKCARYNISDFSGLSVVINDSATSGYDSLIRDLGADGTPDVIPCDAGWEYDRSQYTRTFVQEMDLVCADAKYIQFPQSFYYGGYLVGSAVFGILGDRFGRHRMLIFTIVLRIISGYALVLIHNYWLFAVVRFFQGVFLVGSYILTFVLGTEFVGISKRNVSGIFINIPFAVGYMLLAGIAYWIRDWRMLQVALVTPLFILLIFLIILPESPRWLISQGETEKAKKIIKHAAKVNKVQLPEDFLDEHDDVNKNLQDDTHKDDTQKDDTQEKERRPNVTDIFRYRNMRRRILILMYIWSVCAVVYHGFNLSTSSLGINVYLSFFVSAAIEIPAYTLDIFIVQHPWLGRRRSMVLTLLLGGVACLLTIFIAPGPFRAGVAFIGKFGISAAFGLIYLYTIELFPTSLRTAGLGICSMTGRIANILAPLILLTTEYWIHTPLVIFGSCTILAGILCLFLPETRGKKLPETIEDGENFGKLLAKTVLPDERI